MEHDLKKDTEKFMMWMLGLIIAGGIFSATYIVILLPFIYVASTDNWKFSGNFLKNKNDIEISIKESFILIIFFTSIYTLYLLLITTFNITALYYDKNSTLTNITNFNLIIIFPIFEEFIFRGIGSNAFEKYGRVFSVLITAMFFVSIHLGVRAVVVLPSAIMFGIIMVLTKNIIFPIILHIFINSWIFSWSNANIFIKLFYSEKATNSWNDYIITFIINVFIALLTFKLLYTKSFFKDILKYLKISTIREYIRANKKVYKELFSFSSVRIYLCIMIIYSLYNIGMAISLLS